MTAENGGRQSREPNYLRARRLLSERLKASVSDEVQFVDVSHGGGLANLDVLLRGKDGAVGIESKLTETLGPHRPVDWRPPYELLHGDVVGEDRGQEQADDDARMAGGDRPAAVDRLRSASTNGREPRGLTICGSCGTDTSCASGDRLA